MQQYQSSSINDKYAISIYICIYVCVYIDTYIMVRFNLYTQLKMHNNQVELEKMAAEGYPFAKLPKCYLLPQFRDWVVYRKGVVFSEIDIGARELINYC